MEAAHNPMSTQVADDSAGGPLSISEPVMVDPPPGLVAGQPSKWVKYDAWLLGGGSVTLFMLVWEQVAKARVVPEMFLPGPTDIVVAFGEIIASGELLKDIATSAQELLIGSVLAIAVGLPLGILMGWYRRFSLALDPFVNFLNSTPRVALTPLLIIWLGIGINSKIALVFLGALFAIMINTMAGVRNTDAGLVKTARSFGATDLQLFTTVVLPGAVPFILAGFRLAIGHALIAVVVGELIAARSGIGMMIAQAGATFQTAKVFAGLIIIAGSGVAVAAALQRLENHFQSWRPSR